MQQGECKMKTKRIVSLVLSVITLFLTLPSFSVATDGLTISEAARLVRGFEEAYLMTVESNKAPLFWQKDKNISLSYEYRLSNDNPQYEADNVESGAKLYMCIMETYDELLQKLKLTFTDEMSKKILNDSRFIYIDGKAYYPRIFFDPGNFYVISDDENTEVPLEERITIVDNGDGRYTVHYNYWAPVEDDNENHNSDKWLLSDARDGQIDIVKTDDGFRVYKYDGLLFKSDPLADRGLRKTRLLSESPHTSDAPVIAVCALALSAAAAAVVLRKKRG